MPIAPLEPGVRLRNSEDLLDRIGQMAGVGGWAVERATMQPRWA